MTDSIEENSENRVYEVGYLLLPSIPEEQVSTHVSQIKKLIEGVGGQFISEEDPKLRHLAYEMTKLIGTRNEGFRSAYFGWVKFEMPAGGAITLKEKLDADAAILRYLLIKTVRENTYIPRAGASDDVATEAPSDAPAAIAMDVPIVVSEDLDKSIDALVTE